MKFLKAFSVILFILIIHFMSLSTAYARAGGGHSSSSHSSSSRSSSSGSSSRRSYGYNTSRSRQTNYANNTIDSDIILIVLIILLLILIVVWYIEKNKPTILINQHNIEIFDEAKLTAFKEHDPNFSRVLLLDFVQLLYARYYQYYGKREFNFLNGFLEASVRHDVELDRLINQQVIKVTELVINAQRFYFIGVDNNEETIGIEIYANYSIRPVFYTSQTARQQTRYTVIERWVLARQQGIVSLPPERMRALLCPMCAAPAQFTDSGQCLACHHVIHLGQVQWYVKQRQLTFQAIFENTDLVSYANETGTNLPSVISPVLNENINLFSQKHAITWASYWLNFQNDIVRAYFMAFNNAWSECQLENVRHILADRLYETQLFWIQRYQENQWRNQLDNLMLNKIELVAMELDTYYESITVRLFASCNDYTLDNNHHVIGGSKYKKRRYSEYWNFVRRSGVENSSSVFSLNQCPQCAAPADNMGQAGICGYCHCKISHGDFSWVLFAITQDEVYSL